MTKFKKEMNIYVDKLEKEITAYVSTLNDRVTAKNIENGDKYVIYKRLGIDITKYIIQYGVTLWDKPHIVTYLTKYQNKKQIVGMSPTTIIDDNINKKDFDKNTSIKLTMKNKLTKESSIYTSTWAEGQSKIDKWSNGNEGIIKTEDERLKKLKKQLKEL